MKHNILSVIILISCFYGLLLFNSCRSTCEDEVYYYDYLTNEEKVKIPYIGYNTLVDVMNHTIQVQKAEYNTLIYLNNLGDSTVLERQFEQYNFSIRYHQDDTSNFVCLDCCNGNDWDMFECVACGYSSSTNSIINEFYFENYVASYEEYVSRDRRINIKIDASSYGGLFTGGLFTFKGLSDGCNNELLYNDTVSINGQLFYGITIYGTRDGEEIADDSIYVVYNYHYGVLKIQLSDSFIWLKQ